ncbi:MAG: FG-GAP-like repeat-containing protein [Pirellulaceae bacterium]
MRIRAALKKLVKKRRRKTARKLLFETAEPRILLVSDWQNPFDVHDTNGDAYVSQIDVLIVINTLNREGPRLLNGASESEDAFYDVSGDGFVSPIDALLVINRLNANGDSPVPSVIAESHTSFESHQTVDIQNPGEMQELTFRIEDTFSTSAANETFSDRLLVYISERSDLANTLLNRSVRGTSVFSLSATDFEVAPGISRWDGDYLTVNLSGLLSSDDPVLVFQMLNGDGLPRSMVRTSEFAYSALDSEVFSSSLPVPVSVEAGGTVEFGSLQEIESVDLRIRNARYDSDDNVFRAELALVNNGENLGRNVVVAFNGLPTTASIINPSGISSEGIPFMNFQPAIGSGGFTWQDVSDTVLIEIRNPGNKTLDLSYVVYSGAQNNSPTLAPLAPLSVFPGSSTRIQFDAFDEDTDHLEFSIELVGDGSHFPNMIFENERGLLLTPLPDDLGIYEFNIVVSDGALTAMQPLQVNVIEDPQASTRVSGAVLNLDGSPVVGIHVEIGGVIDHTDALGNFLLELGTAPIPSDTLRVRGELVTGDTVYPFIAEKLGYLLGREVINGVNNVIERPIYLPSIDIGNAVPIDPQSKTVVETAAIPYATVTVEPGTLVDQQGTPFDGLMSITEVPSGLTPAALPRTLVPDMVVTIQPGEMNFMQPAPLTLPNRGGYLPGSDMDLWSINPTTGEFEIVGKGQVTSDGQSIVTTVDGIRNSSWHFFSPPPEEMVDPKDKVQNQKQSCCSSEATQPASSDVELHSGALRESHTLAGYQSLGTTHSLSLQYDSQRASQRPIIHFGAENVIDRDEKYLAASLSFQGSGLEIQVPGFAGVGLAGEFHFWDIPDGGGNIEAALQGDLSDLPTGIYEYTLRQGLLERTNGSFTGSLVENTGEIVSVNARDSIFGAGWQLGSLQQTIEEPSGRLLLFGGFGTSLIFGKPEATGEPFISPAGDFTTLVKNSDSTYTRTTKYLTVYLFGTDGLLRSVTDRNGNTTEYVYEDSRLIKIIDPVGLETEFVYSGNLVSVIRDPGGRETRFEYDGHQNLVRIIDPDLSTRNFAYNGEHQLIQEIDQRGFIEEVAYGFHGRVVGAKRADGSEVQFSSLQTISIHNSVLTSNPASAPMAKLANAQDLALSSDSRGNLMQVELDQQGQQRDAVDQIGRIGSENRNGDNQVVQAVDARGNHQNFEYDNSGNVTSITDSAIEQQLFDKALFPQRTFFTDKAVGTLHSADINGDGFADVLVAPKTQSLIELFVNVHAGQFKKTYEIDTNLVVETISTGDYNGDGFVDIVFASRNSPRLTIVFGDAEFSFTNVSTIDTDASITSMFSEDLDLDGFDDCLLQTSQGKLFILFGDDTTFELPSEIGTARSADAVYVSDVDADKRPDILVAHEADNLVSFFRNSDSRSFENAVEFPIESPTTILASDFNGDDLIDLAVHSESRDAVTIYVSAPDDFFSQPQELAVLGAISDLQSGDFDGDGIVELAYARNDALRTESPMYSAALVSVENDGLVLKAQYASVLPIGLGGFRDFNRDGYDDILLESGQAYFSVRNGSPTGQDLKLVTNNIFHAFVAQDVDSDGDQDVLARGSTDNFISVFLNGGEGNFSIPAEYSLGQVIGGFGGDGGTEPFFVRDFDQDGIMDVLAIGSDRRSFSLLAGLGDGTFDAPAQTLLSYRIASISVGHLDANGTLDVAILGQQGTTNSIQTFAGNGMGGFAPLETVELVGTDPYSSIQIADGLPEQAGSVAVTNFFARTLQIRRASTEGILSTPIGFAIRGELLVADFNNDSRDDLVDAESDRFSFFRQSLDGSFEQLALSLPVLRTSVQEYKAVDLNADGYLDIAAIASINNQNGISLNVWYGDGNFAFGEPHYYELNALNTAFSSFDIADLNGDQAFDLLFNRGIDDFSIFELAVLPGSEKSESTAAPIVFEYDTQFNSLRRFMDEMGRATLYDIDPSNGNRLSSRQVVGDLDSPENGETDDLVTSYTYTAAGLVESMTDPLGRRTEYVYTANGLLESVRVAVGTSDEAVRSFEYDALGNQTASIDERGNRTEFEYDAMNRLTLIREADPDGDGPLSSPTTSFEYDAKGNVVETVDAAGSIVVNTYDPMNRLASSVDELGNQLLYGYDAEGNLTSVTDPLGLVSRNRYDSRDRLIESIDPEGGRVSYAYDLANNLASLTDPIGNTTRFFYDARNRLIQEIDPLGKSTYYQYDLADNLIEKRDRNNRLTRFQYDVIDRVVNEQWIAANGTSVENSIDYGYDKASNLVEISDNFSHLTYEFDARNRVVSIDNTGTPDVPGVTLGYSYDAANNVLVVTDTINGVARGTNAYEYDGLNRMISVKQSGPNVAEKAVDFIYNQIGQFDEIRRYADLSRNSLVARTDYAYDAINRLTDLDHLDAASSQIAFYDNTFDSTSRIAAITDQDGETRYSYDDRSQLIRADRDASDLRGDESYTYDANGNRLSSHRHGNGYQTDENNRLVNDGTYRYEYDNEGNVIKRIDAEGAYREFIWDNRNRLVRVTDFDSTGGIRQDVRYAYDVFNRRIAKTIDHDGSPATAITSFVYQGSDIALQFTDVDGSEPLQQPQLEKRNLHGPAVDQILAQETTQGVSWLLPDHLGSVRTVLASDGLIIDSHSYDSYGNSQITASGYGFTGREFDSETGLYYYRARYYDAAKGRFLSEDPIRFDGGDGDLYRYVFNNPISYTDPSGEFAFLALAIPYLAAASAGFIGGFAIGAGFDAADQYSTNECIDLSQVSRAGLKSGLFDAATFGAARYFLGTKLFVRLLTKAPKRLTPLNLAGREGKLIQHAPDWGIGTKGAVPSGAAQRMEEIVRGIHQGARQIRKGRWHQYDDAIFYFDGNHIVVTQPDGTLLTVLKDAANNKWFNQAGVLINQ